jgi:hypothetical protein
MGIRAAEYGYIKHIGEYDIGGVYSVAADSLIGIHSG